MGIWIPGGVSDSGGGANIPLWSTGTDEEIVAAVEAHYAGEIDLTQYWSVGDERTVHLSAMSARSPLSDTHVEQDVVFVLSNVGGKTLSDGVTECLFQVDQKDCLKETGVIAYSSNLWTGVVRRTWCNNNYRNAIPETLRQIFKEYINQVAYPNVDYMYTTNDYFALRSEMEIYGRKYYGRQTEGTQVDLYKIDSNRIKKVNGADNRWWTRTAMADTNGQSYTIISKWGTYGSEYLSSSEGIAPFGVI